MTTTATPVAAGPGAARPRSRSLAWVLVAVGVPMFMVTLDNLVVTTALPVIKTEIGASLSDLSWFVNAYTLPFAALWGVPRFRGSLIGFATPDRTTTPVSTQDCGGCLSKDHNS